MGEIIVGIFIAMFMVSAVFALSAVVAAGRADKRSSMNDALLDELMSVLADENLTDEEENKILIDSHLLPALIDSAIAEADRNSGCAPTWRR